MIISKLFNLYVFFLFIANVAFSQVFIPIDTDTNEFIDDVNYSLFNNKQSVYSGVTLRNQVTRIDESIVFDSISFSKIDYQTLGLAKSNIDSVILLSKKIIYLDEMVITSKKDKTIVLGEANRFVKKRSRPITENLLYGVVFENKFKDKFQLDKILFYIDKVNLKTAYKVNVLSVEETPSKNGHKFALPGELLYVSDVLYLNFKDAEKVMVNIPSGLYLQQGKPVFVWVELIGYYDEDGKKNVPDREHETKLKFQLSNEVNYYSRRSDLLTKELSPELINENLIIKYDFANGLFKKPHKSILVAPAILLYASRVEE